MKRLLKPYPEPEALYYSMHWCRSHVLVFFHTQRLSVFTSQEVITFTIGTRILSYDSDNAKYSGSSTPASPGPSRRSSGVQDAEAVSLLDDQGDPFDEHDGDYISSVHRPLDMDSSRVSRFYKRSAKFTKRAVGWINPVVAGALLAVLFGV